MEDVVNEILSKSTIDEIVYVIEKNSSNYNVDILCREIVLQAMVMDESFLCNDHCKYYEALLYLVSIGFVGINPILPLIVLGDIIDVCGHEDLHYLVNFVERYFVEYTKEPIFSNGKFQFIRLANNILRNLPQTRYPLECGKMHIMLSKYVPIYEKSGLNLNGEYSADVIGNDAEAVDYNLPLELQPSDELETISNISNKSFFEIFWQLQTYVKSPTILLSSLSNNKNTVVWDNFINVIEDILNTFSRFYPTKMNENDNASRKRSFQTYDNKTTSTNESFIEQPCQSIISNTSPFYVKINRYYPNIKLLERQINDPKFHIHVLFQLLTLFSSVDTGVKNNSKLDLNSTQKSWILSTYERIYDLLDKIGPMLHCDVSSLFKMLQQKEKLYVDWKEKCCPPIVKNKPSEYKHSYKPINFSRFDTSKSMNLGNPFITRLWNICPNNMESCKMPSRDCIPTIDQFFEQAISQLNPTEQIEEEYRLFNNPSFQWRASRLLSRTSSKYFSSSYQPNMTPNQYLMNVLNSVYNKDLLDPTSMDNSNNNNGVNIDEILTGDNNDTLQQNINDFKPITNKDVTIDQ